MNMLIKNLELIYNVRRTTMELTKENLDKQIEQLTIKQEAYELQNDDYYIDNDYHTERTPYCNELRSLKYERGLLNYAKTIEYNHYGYLVNGKYIVTKKGHWKNLKGKKWYKYGKIEDLFKNYIDKPYENRENKGK
jgi:hypothetical protein